MRIALGQFAGEFAGWSPAVGPVFTAPFAIDVETTLIDTVRDWITPAYVLAAAFDGTRGVFLTRERIAEFLAVHADVPVIMHHAPFDLAVLQTVAGELDVYEKVDRNLAWDTQLLHKLYVLGTAGHTARGRDQSTLERCAFEYLGVEMSKTITDSEGDDVRRSYAKWLNHPPQEIEPVYLDYLGQDVIATWWIFHELMSRLSTLMTSSSCVWGSVSPAWTAAQVARWGPQTHHIQLKSSIVLRAIKANGISIDETRREQLNEQLAAALDERRQALRQFGYLPGQPGSDKALQEIMRRLQFNHPRLSFPKTATGKFVTAQETLQELAHIEPFIRNFLEYKAIEKLRSTFVSKLSQPVIHPSFDPLMVTGRTSSYGELNAQNLPRDNRVRSCFVPSPGHVFIDADYAALEMATLSQAVQAQFGWRSAMAEAINDRQDLHRLVAARVTHKLSSDVTREERQRAKAINFGKPGGMGDVGLQRYAKASYGVDLSDVEVQALSNSWFDLFPEMRAFLQDSEHPGQVLASFFRLTPRSVFEATGIRRFLDHRENEGCEDRPNEMLGWMMRKVLRDSEPHSARGVPYDATLVDHFWNTADSCLTRLSMASQEAIRRREPSSRLAWEVQQLAEKRACMTLTCRIRANTSYCARHNTLFQGLAADGAKLALWRLWRAEFRIVNFVHDEVLVEVSADSDLREAAESIKAHMIAGMQEVVHDVRIDVAYAACDRWYKDAEAVFGDDGSLLLWHPPPLSADVGETSPSPAPPDPRPMGREPVLS